ncbi:EscT/YscT/HrcT family type III secretion system export apparatus protein [Burkholderia diffusa]|uniref:EscT/YscT/HrcT family type III secretion system export apparatus protein n=1 Tax=Burkholderia diffusa TaxID=488732 RepID=UPI00075C02EA|nr:flagellar biosynthetic protein FliR [Burkholderia diffusa]KVN02932.1 hypothetical protein WJ62_12030 [Burkholderia diffusa]
MVEPSSPSVIAPIEALLFASARLMAMFSVFPLLQQKVVGNVMRAGLALSIGCLVAPDVYAELPEKIGLTTILWITGKESFIGILLGYGAGLLYWAVEGLGTFIDQQTGASSSAVVEPLFGHPQGPTAGFLIQIINALLLSSSGFLSLLSVVFYSYAVWPVFSNAPRLSELLEVLLTGQWNSLTDMMIKLSAPIVLLLALIDVALGLVSRYLHTFDVHFQSMAVKQLAAIVMLIVVLQMLFDSSMAFFSPASQVRLMVEHLAR